jgi:esterase/lipase superfamily enzyme
MSKLKRRFVHSLQFVLLAAFFSPSSYAEDEIAAAEKSDVFHIDVQFLSLRNKTGSKSVDEYFGGERDVLRSGICSVAYTRVDALKTIAENVPFYIPEEELQLDAIRETAVKDIWKDLGKTSAGKSPLIYVHGFNISFDRGCRRASEFQRSLGLGGRLVYFSWPSDGIIVNYPQDETELYWSVDAMHKTLADMVDASGSGKINVVAHSLGTRGIMLALVRMSAERKYAKYAFVGRPLIDQLVLLAAATDVGIFAQYLPYIKPLVKRITVYVSSHDVPLAASEQLHGYPRLGQTSQYLRELQGVEIIDVSDVPVQYPSGHLYHLYNKTVIDDLDQLLNENKAAAERKLLKKDGEGYWRLQSLP